MESSDSVNDRIINEMIRSIQSSELYIREDKTEINKRLDMINVHTKNVKQCEDVIKKLRSTS
jgi:hypothetical protein